MNVVEFVIVSFLVWLLVLGISWLTVGLPESLLLSFLGTATSCGLIFGVVIPIIRWLFGGRRKSTQGGETSNLG